MLKGFMIFLMATAWLVSWSLAELRTLVCRLRRGSQGHEPHEAEGTHTDRL